jgi:hypothetical protein
MKTQVDGKSTSKANGYPPTQFQAARMLKLGIPHRRN